MRLFLQSHRLNDKHMTLVAHTEQTTVALPTLDFKRRSRRLIKTSHFAQLECTIKTESLKEGSKSSLSYHELFFCIQNVIGLIISPQCFGHLLWRKLYRLNRFWIRLDGRSCEATFFNVEKDLFDISTLHVFGSPCFVLDSRLQSGLAGHPKWEPRSRLGIYVGHSPSHAGSIALVLNPRTGHVSPQFHLVFDDLFTTVPFMKKSEVPPNWAEVVANFSEWVTDEDYDLAQTWLFPDAELGNITMQETNHNTRTLAKSNVVQETPLPLSGTRLSSHKLNFSQQSMADNIRISQEDYIPSIQLTPDSVAPSQDDFSPPPLLNVETSGLRRSPRIAAQINSNTPAISAYVTSTMPVTSRQYTRPKQQLSFYSDFTLVGSLF